MQKRGFTGGIGRYAPVLAAFVLATLVLTSCWTSCSLRVAPAPPPDDSAGTDDVGTAPGVSLKELGTDTALNIPEDLAGQPFAMLFFSYG